MLGPFIRPHDTQHPPMLVVQIDNTIHYLPLEPHDLTRLVRQMSVEIDQREQDWRRYARPARLSE